jgi:hypothetical protein
VNWQVKCLHVAIASLIGYFDLMLSLAHTNDIFHDEAIHIDISLSGNIREVKTVAKSVGLWKGQ